MHNIDNERISKLENSTVLKFKSFVFLYAQASQTSNKKVAHIALILSQLHNTVQTTTKNIINIKKVFKST